MTPDLGGCVLCRRSARHRHHLSGRLQPDGPYLDGAATIPLCLRCHVTEHESWRELGLAELGDPVAARLLRLRWFCGRVIDEARLAPEAVALARAVLVVLDGLAAELRRDGGR
ncbi:MAG: hypothetical protein ACRD0B_00420 [Acidimicrobiales bacterium]